MYYLTYSRPLNNLFIFSWNISGLLHGHMGRFSYPYLPQGSTIVHSFLETGHNLTWYYPMIKSCPFSRKLCTIVLPWGKYEYQEVSMRLCNSPDIFQEKMNELFNGLEYVGTYIDDLLIISNKSFENHILFQWLNEFIFVIDFDSFGFQKKNCSFCVMIIAWSICCHYWSIWIIFFIVFSVWWNTDILIMDKITINNNIFCNSNNFSL